jgi:cytochrome P450
VTAGGVVGGPGAARDSFADFNRRQGLGTVRDPHRRWAQLRRAAPVHRLTLRELTGRDVSGNPLGNEVYMAFSFDAAVDVLRDPETFSSAFYGRTMGLVLGRTILEMDEPDHFRHRALLQKAFTHGALRRWEERVIGPAAHRCVAAVRHRGRGDLVRDVTFPFPVSVIAGMIGLPEERHAAFHRLAIELISVSFDPARGIAASRALREMFLALLADRRATPRDDLLSVLARAEIDGERLEDEAIVSFLRLLAPAGAETTYRSTSSLLLGLLQHPEQLAALRARRDLIPDAIEEGLR